MSNDVILVGIFGGFIASTVWRMYRSWKQAQRDLEEAEQRLVDVVSKMNGHLPIDPEQKAKDR